MENLCSAFTSKSCPLMRGVVFDLSASLAAVSVLLSCVRLATCSVLYHRWADDVAVRYCSIRCTAADHVDKQTQFRSSTAKTTGICSTYDISHWLMFVFTRSWSILKGLSIPEV